MTRPFKDHFSQGSDAYRLYRPGYPEALFAWMARVAPRRQAALDCGCGSGQAALALARHFEQVYAVDPSAGQIGSAEPHPRVEYRVAPAEATGLPAASVDLVVAAQALHWFDFERFWPEVRRVARPNGVFAAFTYGLLSVDAAVDRVLGHLYRDLLGPHWPPERRHVDEGYRSIPCPFEEIAAPGFAMSFDWSLDHLLGYLETWSAVKAYRQATGSDPLTQVAHELGAAWGDPNRPLPVSWPLVLRAGRIGQARG
jgi:SAM-dependent methyltransferase